MVPPSPKDPGGRPKRSTEARVERGGDVGVEGRGVPPVGRRLEVDGDVGPVIGGDGRDQGVGRHLRIDVGRQAERELGRRVGPQDVAAVAQGGQALGAGHLERSGPGLGDEAIGRRFAQQVEPIHAR